MEASRADRAYMKKNYSKAIPLFKGLADRGSVFASRIVGHFYYHEIKPRDYPRAVKWFKRAWSLGQSYTWDSLKRYDLMDPDDRGIISRKDIWVYKEHESYRNSAFELYDAYRKGKGVPKNINEAIKWLKKVAELGDNGLASSVLGDLYYEGKDVARNYKEAARWYTHAASLGKTLVLSKLGNIYFYGGHGIQSDYKEAIRWLGSAAREKWFRRLQREAEAQRNLGWLYETGNGAPKDLSRALEWYQIAAGHGDAVAQSYLGDMYREGQGVVQDNIAAYMWLNIAASSGDADAVRNRDSLAKEMTAADMSKAQELARACVAKKFKGC